MGNSRPIGLFDSGVGGLTVASAIKQVLPNENMVYFGDTFHMPYGDKSQEAVQYYSTKIADFLLDKGCKVILIACNSASSNAYESVVDYVGERALVLNVIDPVVDYVTSVEDYKTVGVIGTKLTVNSQTYPKRISKVKPNLQVKSLATPLLVPMIEEGFVYDEVSNSIIKSYLSKSDLDGIEALILGCTHYPIIRNQIIKYYNFNVQVLDTAKIVALKVLEVLRENDLLNIENHKGDDFYISDYTDYFKLIAKMFFEKEVNLQTLNIWK